MLSIVCLSVPSELWFYFSDCDTSWYYISCHFMLSVVCLSVPSELWFYFSDCGTSLYYISCHFMLSVVCLSVFLSALIWFFQTVVLAGITHSRKSVPCQITMMILIQVSITSKQCYVLLLYTHLNIKYFSLYWNRLCNGECAHLEPWLGQAKDYEIGMCCFSAKHAALRRKRKDWLSGNRAKVSEWGDMSIHGLLFEWASTIKIQLSVLI
jgi:hypothetical protein